MAAKDAFEMLIEGLHRQRARIVKDPLLPISPAGACCSAYRPRDSYRRLRTPLPPPQQLGHPATIIVVSLGEFYGQRDPDIGPDSQKVQFPAIDPVVPVQFGLMGHRHILTIPEF